MKILVINACARKESNTMKIFNEIKRQKEWTDNDIELLNLYEENIPYLNDEMLNNYSPIQEKLVDQFNSYSQCIIIYPTWNWNVPGILKSYLDLIMVVHKTFKIENNKLIGLSKMQKATIISTTGFKVVPKPIAYLFNINNDRFYVKNMLKIMGTKNINYITLGNFGEVKYSENDIEQFVKKNLHKL